MKYKAYFNFFSSENIKITFWITVFHYFSIYLLHCASELPTPISFLFVNENNKSGYAFS